MNVTDALRAAILEGAPSTELRELAVSSGMNTLRQSGIRAITEGLTSVEEVLRETTH